MIYLHTYSGLASRCNTLSQVYWLAKKYQEKLIIFWEISSDCNISYKDIFDERQFNDIDYKVIEYTTIFQKDNMRQCFDKWMIKIITNIFCCFIRIRGGQIIDYAPPKEMSWLGTDMQKRIVKCGKEVIHALKQKRSILISAFNGLSIDEINPIYCNQSIRFKQRFIQETERILKKEGIWVGVHIRRTDHKLAIEHSSLEAFIEKMKEIEKKNREVNFYLATDDRNVQRRIVNDFKDRVFVLPGKRWGRDNKKAMESAILDCLCLSKCKVILGSYGTRFLALRRVMEIRN